VDLIEEIRALPEVLRPGCEPSEDGSMRYAYEHAEQAILRRFEDGFDLDMNSDRSAGFVRALASFIFPAINDTTIDITVDNLLAYDHEDVPSIQRAGTDARLLADGEQTTTFSRDRLELAGDGLDEIGQLSVVLREIIAEHDEVGDVVTVTRGILARVDELSHLVRSLIGQGQEVSESELERLVTCKRPRALNRTVPLAVNRESEASHG